MISSQTQNSAIVLSQRLRWTANISLWLLFLLCIAWETFLAPLRPGGTFMFLKALPLAFAFRGVSRGSLYTMQWAAMLVLLYLMEGVVRVMSDPPGPSIALAWLEIVLASVFFLAAIFYVRPAKQAYKLAAKELSEQERSSGGVK
jgi:uncharacterized membrane protein